jgi:hypothetical protein
MAKIKATLYIANDRTTGDRKRLSFLAIAALIFAELQLGIVGLARTKPAEAALNPEPTQAKQMAYRATHLPVEGQRCRLLVKLPTGSIPNR